MRNVRLVAERVALLWFSVISETYRQALEEPSESRAKELGVDWLSLRDVSEIVNQRGLMDSLIRLRDVHYSFCSPPPCDFAPRDLRECLEELVRCFERKIGEQGTEAD